MTEEKPEATVPATAIPEEDVKKAAQPTKVPEPVPRPDRQILDKELKLIDAEIEKCKAVLDDVKAKMDKLHGELDKGKDGKDGVRSKLNELRAATKVFAEQRKGLFQDLDKNKALTQALREKSDAMQKTLKETANIKEFSTAAVEKKINDLDYHMSTTPLSLKEEKDVIAQIKALNASKKLISGYDDLQTKKDAAQAGRKELSAKLDENKKSFNAAKELEDAQWEIVKKAGNKDQDKRDMRKTLLEQREKARNEMNEHYGKIRSLRDEYKKSEDQWRKYINAKRAAERERYLKEQEERKEEMKLQKLLDEADKEDSGDANKLASIEQLLAYLAKFDDKKEEEAAKEDVKVEMGGMTQIGKKAMGFDDDIFGTMKPKGKKGKKGKKTSKKQLNFDVKFLQEFDTLKVGAPLTLDDIPKAVADLKAKKEVMSKEKEQRNAKRQEKIKVVEEAIAVKQAIKDKEAAERKAAREAARAEAAAKAEEEGEVAADDAAPAVEAAA